jgi:hypothetical protein
MVVRWSLLQAHFHPEPVWVAQPLSSQGHQARELADLSLWNPEIGRFGGSIAMNGGSGENSFGGSVKIESGVGMEATDLGAASLLTVDAGLAGVSGGLSLITGIAMDGDSGAVVISSGSSGSNKIAITIPL